MWEDILAQIIATLGMVIGGNTIFYWIASFGIKKRITDLGILDAKMVKKYDATVDRLNEEIKLRKEQNEKIVALEAKVDLLLDKVTDFMELNEKRDKQIGAILDER